MQKHGPSFQTISGSTLIADKKNNQDPYLTNDSRDTNNTN